MGEVPLYMHIRVCEPSPPPAPGANRRVELSMVSPDESAGSIGVLRGRFTTCARDDCTWQVYNVCSGCLCLGRFWGLCLERFLGRCLGRFLGLCLGYSLGLCLGWFIMSEVPLYRCTTCARGAPHPCEASSTFSSRCPLCLVCVCLRIPLWALRYCLR